MLELYLKNVVQKLGYSTVWNQRIYSLNSVTDLPQITCNYDGVSYTFVVEWVKIMENKDNKCKPCFNNFFNSVFQRFQIETSGQESLNSGNVYRLDAHNIEVLSSVKMQKINLENRFQLKVEARFKVVQPDNLLKLIIDQRENGKKNNEDGEKALWQAYVGKTVVTMYYKKTYKVCAVDFSQSPDTCFDNNGTQTRYSDYCK